MARSRLRTGSFSISSGREESLNVDEARRLQRAHARNRRRKLQRVARQQFALQILQERYRPAARGLVVTEQKHGATHGTGYGIDILQHIRPEVWHEGRLVDSVRQIVEHGQEAFPGKQLARPEQSTLQADRSSPVVKHATAATMVNKQDAEERWA